ncbi:MAG: alpha/beta hydrolase [Pseudomonadota bacterium]
MPSLFYHLLGQGEAVILLHSSLSSKSQWLPLQSQLAKTHQTLAIDLIGYGDNRQTPRFPFRLNSEIELIDTLLKSHGMSDRPFHIIGHSYGGSIALKMASQYSQQVVSLNLYEPVSFHLLEQNSGASQEAHQLGEQVLAFIHQEKWYEATEYFVDYWNAPGSFASMDKATQEKLMQRAKALIANFEALYEEPMTLSALENLDIPCHLMFGEYSPKPTQSIIKELQGIWPHAHISRIEAGHMGPLTHSQLVNTAILEQLTLQN